MVGILEDKLENLKKGLSGFTNAYNDLKSIGFPEDVLVSYMIVKSKLPKKTILKILEYQDNFYQEFTNNLMLDALE